MGRLSNKLKLLNKIEGYRLDAENAGGRNLPLGKTRIKISAVVNYILYGTSFSEYFAYRFYSLNHKEKKQFMTRRYMFRFFDKYDPKSLRERIGDKRISGKYYGDLMKRDQFRYDEGFERFCEFCRKHKKIFIKKGVSWGGEGTRPEDVSTDEKIKKVWETVDGDVIIEPYLENRGEIKELHPGSLNTVKITTLFLKGGPEIQTALFRVGNNTTVDNVHLGGMCSLVDIETGIVKTEAVDKHFKRYAVHPVTKKQIVGFKIPMWEETKALAIKAACVTKELRYSSWDIAITPDGPVMIEGNWDAEFYAEQMLLERGNRKYYESKLQDRF